MDDILYVLHQSKIYPKTNGYNQSFKRFVCRSLNQENLEKTDVVVVEEMIRSNLSDSTMNMKYQDTFGFVKAYNYLHELTKCDEAGLIDNNVICELHGILMNHSKHLCTVGKYSDKERVAEFEGEIHIYPNNYDLQETMQILINEYNHRWFCINLLRKTDSEKALENLLQLTAWFIYKFLELHPFGDGNGRTIRLLYSYIMESYGFPFQLTPLWFNEIYTTQDEQYKHWCEIIKHIRSINHFTKLEKCIIHSLKMTCKEYITCE